ncbi:MAG: hypothetical protein HY823_07315 [Acidobacteria bacterium]|nr:hypothetical protein [Acidobacteriota bacterium]
MIRFEEQPYGFRLTLADRVTRGELETWKAQCEGLLALPREPFGVLVDQRNLLPLDPDLHSLMVEIHQFVVARGLQRSAVGVGHWEATRRLLLLSREVGAYAYERYLDASILPDWERVALAWILEGVDPDAGRPGAAPIQEEPSA